MTGGVQLFFFFFGYTMKHTASYFADQGLNLCPPAVEGQS